MVRGSEGGHVVDGGAGVRDQLIESDQFTTPACVFDPLHAIYNFKVDLAAGDHNHRVRVYLTPAMNALRYDWAVLSAAGWLWCNPPYSRGNLPAWSEKARAEVQRGAALVMLVPAAVGAGWFQENVFAGHDLIEKRTIRTSPGGWLNGTELVMAGTGGYRVSVRFLRRRIEFENPWRVTNGNVAKQDSALIEWRPRRFT